LAKDQEELGGFLFGGVLRRLFKRHGGLCSGTHREIPEHALDGVSGAGEFRKIGLCHGTVSFMETGAVILTEGDQKLAKKLLVAIQPFEKVLEVSVKFRRFDAWLCGNLLRAQSRRSVRAPSVGLLRASFF